MGAEEYLVKNGLSLQFVSDSLKRDPRVVFRAMIQNGEALQYADESLKRDVDFVYMAIRLCDGGWAALQ
eukprot:CAMPEP_0198652162 /NCGR_PEP_ID=MMETSP1467-20131203/6188_1 /TAXON_ID=1462469 /ORGANISM="unid. sp., Strain CCMP2135" /LENGTH=68 /DNA_ID=CAMNT_0044388067 /DNA_START=37 /DNA_END=243 /DNA_ORIENTATION=-